VVWFTLGGGGPHVPALLEHSYCMLEELQEVVTMRKEEGRTTSAYRATTILHLHCWNTAWTSLPVWIRVSVSWEWPWTTVGSP